MPKFTIECTFDVPHYRHTTYEAGTVEAAMALALADQEWGHQKKDYDSSSDTRITGIWEGEDGAYMGKALEFPDPTRPATVFVVTTCIPDKGETPCLPSAFGTEAEALAYLEEMLTEEWEHHGPYDEAGARLPYPGNWQAAQDGILTEISDGSWGQWRLTSHPINIPI